MIDESAIDQLVIRPLEGADVLACAEAMAASDPWKRFGYSTEDCSKRIGDSGSATTVAVYRGEVIGFLVVREHAMASSPLISLLCVAGTSRGKGFGSRLIQECEKRIFATDTNLFVFASSFNEGAQRLYRRLGYKQVGDFPDYQVFGSSEILFRKTTGPRRPQIEVALPRRGDV